MTTSAPDIGQGQRPRVVIVGGGFGGLHAARQLQDEPVDVLLLDRRNHHLFQPLLYQVATAALPPANISMPIRRLFRRHKNVVVLLGEVTTIDPEAKSLSVDGRSVAYDYLVLATGARHSYFGHDDWEPMAPGLKSIEDALEVRRRFLLAFEIAERETDPARREAALTFVVVGGGPTGVELAGAMAEIAHSTLPEDFRHIDTARARVVIVEGLDRLLSAFPERLSRRAERDLAALGVEVRLRSLVTSVDAAGVTIEAASDGETQRTRLSADNVIWAAGVAASPLGRFVSTQIDRAGRVQVQPDLSVAGRPEVFCVGDLAAARRDGGVLVPGVAQGAIQGGRYVGQLIRKELRAKRRGQAPPSRPPFRYNDKGNVATIGRNRAVADAYGLKLAGFPAWLLWAGIHIAFLIGFRNKLFTMLEWAWMYFFPSRGSRLITESDRHAAARRAATAPQPAARPPSG